MAKSIYQLALGEDFEKLHPQVQKRFGFSSTSQVAAIGRGVMNRVWRGRFFTLPFLIVGSWRNIMFPEQGHDIPFSVENYAYRDGYRRETMTWARKFQFGRQTRRFDATMIFSQQRRRIVDYLGTHQHLAVDIEADVAQNGGLWLRSGEQRFYEGPISFCFPLLFSGVAEVCEWYDDCEQKFKIKVEVKNKVWGPLFGYDGAFEVDYIPVMPDRIPADAKPHREEERE